MNMIFQELLKQTPFGEIERAMRSGHYRVVPEWKALELRHFGISEGDWLDRQMAGYKNMVDELRGIKLKPADEAGMLAAYRPFHWWCEDESLEGVLDPFLVVPGTNDHYALMGIPWEELVSYEVYEKSLEVYGGAAVAAALLEEMAFDGFTAEQARQSTEKLVKSLKQSEGEIAEGRTHSMEELYEDLYERGILEKPTEEEKRETEEQGKADAARYEAYQRELEAFLADSGWLGFAK